MLGRCLCGAVRYRLGAVADVALCHCATCRRASGSAFGAWVEVAAAQLTLVAGVPRVFAGDGTAAAPERAFCGDCGTPLWHVAPSGARRVALGTLDDPGAVPARVHVRAHEQLPWLRLADLLAWTEEAEPPPPAQRQVWVGPPDPSVTRTSPVSLRAIDAHNRRAVLLADVHGHQRRFVAPNAVSLAQLPQQPDGRALAIHAGEVVVGLTLLNRADAELVGVPLGEPYLWRFMIDARYQGLGLGRRALELIIAEARHLGAQDMWLSYVPSRVGPRDFYARCGFVDTGFTDADGEAYMKRPFAAPAPPSTRA